MPIMDSRCSRWTARPEELGGSANITTPKTVAPMPIDAAQVNAPLEDQAVPF